MLEKNHQFLIFFQLLLFIYLFINHFIKAKLIYYETNFYFIINSFYCFTDDYFYFNFVNSKYFIINFEDVSIRTHYFFYLLKMHFWKNFH